MPTPLVILVIDDDDQIASTLFQMIAWLGHEPVRVSSTQMADFIASGGTPDLIMTDVFMPKVEGLSVIRMVEKSALKDVPVIAMSGGAPNIDNPGDVSNSYIARAALDFGAAKFLAKPFGLEQLKKAIADCKWSKETRPVAC